jgi:pantetheine-phosphate adenylyltransferase
VRNDDDHNQEKSIAIYPGSFDPVTNGHLDVIERATFLFDEVFVLVAHNPVKGMGMFTPKDRVQLILDSVAPKLVGASVKADYM